VTKKCLLSKKTTLKVATHENRNKLNTPFTRSSKHRADIKQTSSKHWAGSSS